MLFLGASIQWAAGLFFAVSCAPLLSRRIFRIALARRPGGCGESGEDGADCEAQAGASELSDFPDGSQLTMSPMKSLHFSSVGEVGGDSFGLSSARINAACSAFNWRTFSSACVNLMFRCMAFARVA
ncbi:hypothetical protein DBA20_19295 [Pandoraea capi]|nr:hypothetical protein [Pandoraea sp. LA3]MDN4585124.1 hypothetical protein [Pandoraea capi]